MAANPLAVNLAMSAGVEITWGGWALAALVPGALCLALVPLILYTLYPPEVRLDVWMPLHALSPEVHLYMWMFLNALFTRGAVISADDSTRSTSQRCGYKC